MQPLADRIRPTSVDTFIGQKHLVGQGKPLRIMIETQSLKSIILWGPPGVGKTTLAKILAKSSDAEFVYLSAVSTGIKDAKLVIQEAKKGQTLFRNKTVLFIDEIHRFNKAQQDFFLPFVEDGTIILIGATTENPSFEIISPLLSRMQVFVLKELSEEDLAEVIERGTKELSITIKKDAKRFLVAFANGDARQTLNLLENTVNLYKNVTVKNLKNTLQSKHLRFDKGGEEHYNTISAFIKSMRASNVDAALYYLARMVDAGEDPLFIARRMVIFASEDIGMAQPTALVVANEVFKACETIGYPECAINLAHGVTYLASAKKDRRAYDAYFKAMDDVKKYGNLPIPLNLRNAPTKLMKGLGYGKGYEMYTNDNLLPTELNQRRYYSQPSITYNDKFKNQNAKIKTSV